MFNFVIFIMMFTAMSCASHQDTNSRQCQKVPATHHRVIH